MRPAKRSNSRKYQPYQEPNKENARRGVALMLMMMLVLYGIVNLFLGVRDSIGLVQFANAASAAEGTVKRIDVVGEERLGGFGTRETNRAVVEFRSADGALQTFVNRMDCARRCPATGALVSVAYDPANPTQAVINDFANRWGDLLRNAFVTLLCFLGASVAWLFTKPPRKDLPKK
jgi:hypothetical protein